MATSSLIGELRSTLGEHSARIQREFESSGDGRAAVIQRTRLIEEILQRLWREYIAPVENPAGTSLADISLERPVNFTLVATGGFGREWLFPYWISICYSCSFRSRNRASLQRSGAANVAGGHGTCGFKLSPAAGALFPSATATMPTTLSSPSRCSDCRYLAGDRESFS